MKKTMIHITLLSIVFQTALTAETVPLQSWRTYTQEPATLPNRMLRSTATERLEGLRYLNTLRTGANLIPYHANRILDTAAQNHMNYLLEQHRFSHYESNTSSTLFTGNSAGDRIRAAGYEWSSYGENLSSGDLNIVASIEGLFSAIYHRFGFLDLRNDEIGIGSVSSTTYGNMYGFNTASTAWWQTRSQNPAYVLWPHNTYRNAQTSFSNYEAPDPLPECPAGGISGNPISIEFNPDKTGNITMTSFKLFQSNGNEIRNTKILSAASDPNGFLTTKQFVLFPMTSLTLDSSYHAVFQYDDSGTGKTISWNFNTRRYSEKRYDVVNGGTYDLIDGQAYILHLKPSDCTWVLGGYSWSNSRTIVERLHSDIFRITLHGDTDFNFGNFNFSLRSAVSDRAIAPSSSQARTTTAALSVIHFLLSSK